MNCPRPAYFEQKNKYFSNTDGKIAFGTNNNYNKDYHFDDLFSELKFHDEFSLLKPEIFRQILPELEQKR